MTTRIDKRFAALKKDGRKALVTFTTAGDPDYETSLELLKALPEAGADVVELGMPFSDPMADGPAIQASSLNCANSLGMPSRIGSTGSASAITPVENGKTCSDPTPANSG